MNLYVEHKDNRTIAKAPVKSTAFKTSSKSGELNVSRASKQSQGKNPEETVEDKKHENSAGDGLRYCYCNER